MSAGAAHDSYRAQIYLDALNSADSPDAALILEALEHADLQVHERPDRAYELASACVTVAARQGLSVAGARGSYLQARVLAERGKLQSALDAIDRARTLWVRAGEQLQAERSNLGRMQILDDLGRHEEAIVVGRALLATLDDSTAYPGNERLRDEVRATAWNNIGVAHSFRGDHTATIAAYAEAEQRYLTLGLTSEAAKTRANRGIELLEIGRGREALGALRAARDSFAGTGDRMWAAKCSGNVADAHARLGEFRSALSELRGARDTLHSLGADAESVRLQAVAARLYLRVGLHREARGEAAQAAQFLLSADMIHDAAGAILTCALVDLRDGDLDAAEPGLAHAKDLFERVGDQQSCGFVMLAQADAAARGGVPGRAGHLAREAVDVMRAGGWLVPLAWAYLHLADRSADDAAAALDAAEPIIVQLGLPDLRYALLLRRATRAAQQADHHAEAMLRDAVEIVERLGATLGAPELRIAFRDDHAAAHDALVDLLVRRGDQLALASAAAIADRAKSYTLSDAATGAVDIGRVPADRDDERVTELRANLSATYHAMHDHAAAAGYAALQQRAAVLERELTLRRVHLAAQPAQSRGRGGAEVPSAAPSTPVLSYHFVGEDLLVFVTVDGHRTTQRQSGVRPRLASELARLNAQWGRFALGEAFVSAHHETLVATVTEVLHALYDVLVAPVRDVIDEAGADTIIVVPHRELHQVPFSALHDGVAPLDTQWSITLAATEVRGNASPAAVAGELHLLTAADESLPAITREASAILAAWRPVVEHHDAAATVEALRAAVPGPAIVHVAGHARYRPSSPMYSALRLSDRWVTASEILEFDFAGSLVVLSACETGRLAGTSTEPVGLAWAFLAAGATGVVVSQWSVDDATTAELMGSFYRGLGAGLTPPDALRQAQRRLARTAEHPYYWAAFSFVVA